MGAVPGERVNFTSLAVVTLDSALAPPPTLICPALRIENNKVASSPGETRSSGKNTLMLGFPCADASAGAGIIRIIVINRIRQFRVQLAELIALKLRPIVKKVTTCEIGHICFDKYNLSQMEFIIV